MPNILDADIPITDIRPSETGVESTARAGLRLGAYGNQIAQSQERTGQIIGNAAKNGVEAADNFVTHQQINAGAQHGEQLFANLTDNWNKTANSADPHDPSTAAKWREEQLEPALQQFTSGFYTEKGQQWAQERAEQIRSHMYAKSEADMSTLAKDAVVSTVRTLQNTGSNTVFKDPSALSAQFDNLDHSIEGIIGANPNLKGADAAAVRQDVSEKTKEQYVKSAVMGAIVNGGNWQKIVNDPKYSPYVNGPEIKQFEAQQKYYDHGAAVAAKQEILLNKQIAETDAHAAINKSFADNVSVDDQGNVQIKPQFAKDMVRLPLTNPNAPDAAEKAKTWLDWNESQHKPPPRADNPTAIDGLMKVISDPSVSLDDAKIAVAKVDIGKGITKETSAQMVQLATDMRNLNNPLLTKTMEAAKEIVEPKYSGVSSNPGGFAKFYYDFIHNQYLPAKVGGTLPPDALDMSQPNSMISKALSAATGGPGAQLPAAISANGGVGGPALPVYTAPKPGAAPAAAPKPPAVGEMRSGYIFQGGNPADPKSWKPGT